MSDIEDPAAEQQSRKTIVKDYLREEVTESWGDGILILSCFVTGLLDSAIFNVWSCFVSMQTGTSVMSQLQPRKVPVDSPPLCRTLYTVGNRNTSTVSGKNVETGSNTF